MHPEGWARVGAGVKWLRVVEAAAPHGLAPLSGSITDVGIVGYTTGGGLGPMARTYGLASDRVRAIEVVTGDGELRRATPTEHPDLFFGLRGGKGALGIVTAIEFDLVQQPRFYGGSLWFDGEHAATVIEQWRAWIADLPEAGTTSFALFQLPDMPGVPPQLAGRLTLSVRYVWTGDAAEGARAVRRDARGRAGDPRRRGREALHRNRFGAHRPAGPDPGAGGGGGAHRLPRGGGRRAAAAGRPRFAVAADPGGGAADGRGDRPAGAHDSAFCSRDAAYSVLIVGIAGVPGAAEHADSVLDALAPWAGEHRLPNFTFHADEFPSAYDDWTLARLRRAVRTYDPSGVMAFAQALES